MGAELSNPISDQQRQEMQDIIQEVVGTFSKVFPIKYKDALIAKLKEEAQPEDPVAYQLLEPPIPTEPLRIGQLTKRGDIMKNWKKRFFTVRNQSDNYVVEYGSAESSGLKGTINCCGYRVRDFDDEETKSMGEFGMKLVPYDDRRRTWYFRADNEEELREWKSIFSIACRKASPPMNPDETIRKAFIAAYNATKRKYWEVWIYDVAGDEGEMLGGMVSQILNYKLLRRIIDDLPESPMRSKVAKVVTSTAEQAVMSACTAAWKASCGSVDALKGAVENSARQLLSPLFEAEANLKGNVTDAISSKLDPALSQVSSALQPFVSRVVQPITNGYIQAIEGFANEMRTNRLAAIKAQPSSLKYELSRASYSLRRVQSKIGDDLLGPFEQVRDILTHIPFVKDAIQFMDDAIGAVVDDVDVLFNKALYTFQTILESDGSRDPDNILKEVIAKFVNDAKIMEGAVLINKMVGKLAQPKIDEVLDTVSGALEPISSMIPDPVKDLIDINTIAEDIIQGVADNAFNSIVGAVYDNAQSNLDNCAHRLGA